MPCNPFSHTLRINSSLQHHPPLIALLILARCPTDRIHRHREENGGARIKTVNGQLAWVPEDGCDSIRMPRQKIRHGNDAIVSGHLDKIGRFSNSRRGFYQLTGSILAKSSKKKIDEVRWQLDVCDATVTEHGRNGIAIIAGKKFLALYARDYKDWHRWFTALQLAALQKVENFYSVQCQVGEGGFASVYKARDIETGEVVALKSIDKSASAKSFLSREVAILKDMDCPYVCSTYDIFETATKMHLVLEYMAGGSLYDLLEERGSLSEFETRKVMRQILAGVYYMHGRGAVHRDLKPENILIAKAGDLGDLRLGDCKNGFNSNCVLGRNNNDACL
jgi:Protein kinase domain